MTNKKLKPNAGNGGKRGHSAMSHFIHNDEIKNAAKKLRRTACKHAAQEQMTD